MLNKANIHLCSFWFFKIVPSIIISILLIIVIFSTHLTLAQQLVLNGRIAFATNQDGDFEIYTMNPDGSDILQLTNNTANDFAPVWSPDGTQITFTSDLSGFSEIYVMNSDGTNAVNLTGGYSGRFPAWSPDGTRIVFSSGRDGVGDDIFVMNADGSNPINLTNSPDSFDQRPTWSPDGTQIAFISTRDKSGISSNDPGYDLFVMDADGSNPVNLATGAFNMTSPFWSPDGNQLTFSMDTLYYNVYIVNADGSDLTRLPASGDVNGRQPGWSPDGQRIIFVRFSTNGADISVMNPDGSNLTTLLQGIPGVSYPAWQPVSVLCDSTTSTEDTISTDTANTADTTCPEDSD